MSTPLKKPRSSSAARVAAYRKRMREQGLVPRTVWTWDTRDPIVIAEIRAEAKAIAAMESHEREVLDWIERATDWPPEDTVPDVVGPGGKT